MSTIGWKEKLKIYLESKEHANVCSAWSEGLTCCLEEPHVLEIIEQLIREETSG